MKTREPIVGPAFNQDFMNDAGVAQRYRHELEYYILEVDDVVSEYKARAAALADELRECEHACSETDFVAEVLRDCDDLLSEFGQDYCEYLAFGPFEHTGDVGFYYLVEHALEESDLSVSDLSEVPDDFVGQLAVVNDHGNLSVYSVNGPDERTLIFDCV